MLHDAVESVSHFNRVGDGALGLFFKPRSTSIPELQGEVGGIDYGGRVTRAKFFAYTFREGATV